MDAVAVVDSETVPAGGVGVKGKYRVKYATGKTYHVRNFALINADKPWGEGDEIPVGAKFKEGKNVELTGDIVFDSITSLPKGTVGVVTHFGSTSSVEVVLGGLLFHCNQSQLHGCSILKKGALVSQLRSFAEEQTGAKWKSGRVDSVQGDKVTVMTPHQQSTLPVTVKANAVQVCHFVEGQCVQVASIGSEWKTGTVEKVLPSGEPLVNVANRPLMKYFFVAHALDDAGPAPTYALGGSRDVDEAMDEDPLISMGAYITMDSAMLMEAEIMRRKWIEAQRLRETVQMKLKYMAETGKLERHEAVCACSPSQARMSITQATHNAVLHKRIDERMGTVFHLENVLILTKVDADTASEVCNMLCAPVFNLFSLQRCGVGRFIGRQLVAIDDVHVHTTQDVVNAAAGKSVMNLQFDAVCNANHVTHT